MEKTKFILGKAYLTRDKTTVVRIKRINKGLIIGYVDNINPLEKSPHLVVRVLTRLNWELDGSYFSTRVESKLDLVSEFPE